MQRLFLGLRGVVTGLVFLTPQLLTAQGEPAWVEQASTTARPDARWGLAMVYNPSLTATLMFGGTSDWGATYPDGLWIWQGFDPAFPAPPRAGHWTLQATTSPRPLARDGHNMVYDSINDRVVLFGGRRSGSYFNDTWFWTWAGKWQQVSTPVAPTPRAQAAMAFDPLRNRVVLFGGFDGTDPLGDTWEFGGTTWVQVATTNSPPIRYGPGATFDTVRNRMVLYGGNWGSGNPTRGDTWEYDGLDWIEVFPAQSPGPCYTPSLAFDTLRHVTVLYHWDDTWEYDGVNWVAREPQLPIPEHRQHMGMVYDDHRGRMVMFGGWSHDVPLNDTWEYYYPYGYRSWGEGCAGSQGVPSLDVLPGIVTPARLGHDFPIEVSYLPVSAPVFIITGLSTSSWSGAPLPTDLASYGMPGCTLYVSVNTSDFVLAAGTKAQFTVSMPTLPMFLGYQLHHQALVLDPAAGNPLGAVMSNPGTATIGN